MRAIADVATAVTKGDLTRSIAVEALGEVAALKDNINEMIVNLAETTRKNTDQDWLKTNIAKFTGMMQGQRDLVTVSRLLLSELTPLVGAQHGTFYITDEEQESLKLLAAYASNDHDDVPKQFRMGQGLAGQCALEKRRILVTDVPKEYIRISSSLGEATPLSIVVLPVLFEGDTRAVIELASFRHFTRCEPGFPRSAYAVDRHRAEYHRGHHADGTTAESRARRWPSNSRRPTPNWRKRPACWPSRRTRWKPRTAKSNRPKRRLKRKPNSCR